MKNAWHAGTHGISVSDTCKLEAEGLRIISEAAHGISMNGLHASAKLVKCTVKDCAWSGVALGGGSTLEATGCEFTGARECMGVHVEGSQTSASLQYTNISRNKGSGVLPTPFLYVFIFLFISACFKVCTRDFYTKRGYRAVRGSWSFSKTGGMRW